MVIFESRDCSKKNPPLSSFQICPADEETFQTSIDEWLPSLKHAVETAKKMSERTLAGRKKRNRRGNNGCSIRLACGE